jgi:hypothetical protein
MTAAADSPRPASGLASNGLWLVLALVVVGMGIGTIYYRWKAPPLIAERRAMLASLPKEGEPRLQAWMDFGPPMIHNRLRYLRLSEQQPWIVTHVVEQPDGPPAVFGVDFTELPVEMTTRDGMTVVVSLPAPRELARAEPRGDLARSVPRFRPGQAIPAADRRLEEMVEYALRHPDDFIARMERDVAGATLVVEVGASERARGGTR